MRRHPSLAAVLDELFRVVRLVPRQSASLSRRVPVEQRERRFPLSEAVGFRHFDVDHQAFAAAEIACEPGKAIILKAVGLGCTITIPAQQLSSSSGMQSLQSQTGEKSLLTVVVGSGLKYTTSGWACQFMGVPSGSYSDGSMELDLRTS